MTKFAMLRHSMIFLSCLISLALFPSWKEPKYCHLSDKIISRYSKKLRSEKKMILYGSGGTFMYDIEQVGLHYSAPHVLSIEEARKLYIEVTQNYLDKYNRDPKIRPYLHNYPFGIENLDITIAFRTDSGARPSENQVAYIYCIQDSVICYDAYDIENQSFHTIYSESYEDALGIIQKDRAASTQAVSPN